MPVLDVIPVLFHPIGEGASTLSVVILVDVGKAVITEVKVHVSKPLDRKFVKPDHRVVDNGPVTKICREGYVEDGIITGPHLHGHAIINEVGETVYREIYANDEHNVPSDHATGAYGLPYGYSEHA